MEQRVQYLINFCIVLIIATGCSMNGRQESFKQFNADAIQLQMQNGIVMRNGKPFSGIIYRLSDNKRDTTEITGFRKGKEHGIWKKFYPGGKPMSIRFFDNGKKVGNFHAWWPNGKPQFAYHFEDGEYEGKYREWNEAGVLVNERTYKKGYEEGVQKQFYDDGRIRSNYVMIDGKRYGLLGTKNCVNVTDSIFKN